MANIYLSNWSPVGVRKSWERTSITRDSAEMIIVRFYGDPVGVVDACAWFDDAGVLRCMVADAANGKRYEYRKSAGKYSMKAARSPAHDHQ